MSRIKGNGSLRPVTDDEVATALYKLLLELPEPLKTSYMYVLMTAAARVDCMNESHTSADFSRAVEDTLKKKSEEE